MFDNVRIVKKLPRMIAAAAILPLAIVLLILGIYQVRIKNTVIAEGLSKMAVNVYDQCKVQTETVDKYLDIGLRFAHMSIQRAGGVRESGEGVSWRAKNQFSGEERDLRLPQFLVGGQWLGRATTFNESVPIVDEVTAKTGVVCTIFQRMNEEGDMLRVATTVKAKNGARAVGTYIPAETGGVKNAVVSTILSGKAYSGRAFVVDGWYYVKYEPLLSQSGRVLGMNFVGVRESELKSLREYILAQRIGTEGYVFVLQGQGENKVDLETPAFIIDARDLREQVIAELHHHLLP